MVLAANDKDLNIVKLLENWLVNSSNDSVGLCLGTTVLPTVIHTKVKLFVKVLDVVSNEDYVMLPHFLLEGY